MRRIKLRANLAIRIIFSPLFVIFYANIFLSLRARWRRFFQSHCSNASFLLISIIWNCELCCKIYVTHFNDSFFFSFSFLIRFMICRLKRSRVSREHILFGFYVVHSSFHSFVDNQLAFPHKILVFVDSWGGLFACWVMLKTYCEDSDVQKFVLNFSIHIKLWKHEK